MKNGIKYIIYILIISCIMCGCNNDNTTEISKHNFEYNKAGKNVNVYRFGGEGNDWCFVRTPENYDPNRIYPYPFVICNHGNGWTMDGSIEKANWTKCTMYLPLIDADYINNPDQYNGIDDKSLWYSNPTIEALLNAGYIVCGAENYGDNLYGNDNCRNACVDFYNHMVNNYNVEETCYMIGASNGAQTSINACYLLGDKVKAIILQYPLTCLVNQYYSNPNHQDSIKKAYGITDINVDRNTLIELTNTHDALNTQFTYFPPTLIYYSSTDSVVNCNENAIQFIQYLESKSIPVVGIQVDTDGVVKEHGHYSHFNPAEYVEWFNTYEKKDFISKCINTLIKIIFVLLFTVLIIIIKNKKSKDA